MIRVSGFYVLFSSLILGHIHPFNVFHNYYILAGITSRWKIHSITKHENNTCPIAFKSSFGMKVDLETCNAIQLFTCFTHIMW